MFHILQNKCQVRRLALDQNKRLEHTDNSMVIRRTGWNASERFKGLKRFKRAAKHDQKKLTPASPAKGNRPQFDSPPTFTSREIAYRKVGHPMWHLMRLLCPQCRIVRRVTTTRGAAHEYRESDKFAGRRHFQEELTTVSKNVFLRACCRRTHGAD